VGERGVEDAGPSSYLHVVHVDNGHGLYSMGLPISFPFERDKFYSIGELRAFQTKLSLARQRDPVLSANIRARKLPWAKLYCEELFPIRLFADHNRLPGDAEFRIMPEGNSVDVELRSSPGLTRFQITTAYAEWDEPGDEARDGGYIRHALEMAGVNQGTPVFGGGQIEKTADGQIVSNPRARSPDIDRVAWHLGLTKAIRSKLAKSETYSQKVDVLLVYAEWLRLNTINEKTEDVVSPAIQEAIRDTSTLPFMKLIILDQGAYVEYRYKPTGAS
jgi:hypothetical protein